MSKIAIDFGTTRTKVAFLDPEKREPKLIELGRENRSIIPSLFYIPKEGKILVGDDAQEAIALDRAGIIRGLKMEIDKGVALRINGRKITRIDLASELFAWIKQQCNEKYFFENPTKSCVITIPPSFAADARKTKCIVDAAERGGFDEIETIEEPVAAAKHWLTSSPTANDFIVVCDIGGGTSDIALVEKINDENDFNIYPNLPPTGIPFGGNDIDEEIFDGLGLEGIDIKEKASLLIKIRQIKEFFSRSDTAQQEIIINNEKVEITRDYVAECCETFIDTLCTELSEFMKKSQQINNAAIKSPPLLLVGGGMNILGLQESISKIWLGKVYPWVDSEYATVCGAIVSGTFGPSPVAEKLFEDAFDLWQSGEISSFPKVIELCEEALEESKGALAKASFLIIAANKKIKAQDQLDKALSKWQKNLPNTQVLKDIIEYCDIALSFYDSRDLPNQALEYYDEKWLLTPYYLKALALEKNNQVFNHLEEIEILLSKFISINAYDKNAIFKKGRIHLLLGDKENLEKASADFSQSLACPNSEITSEFEDTITDNQIHLYRAYVAYKLGNNIKAINELKLLSKVDEETSSFHPSEILISNYIIAELSNNTYNASSFEYYLACLSFNREFRGVLHGNLSKIHEELKELHDWFNLFIGYTDLDSLNDHIFDVLLTSTVDDNDIQYDDIKKYYNLIKSVNLSPWKKLDGSPLKENKNYLFQIAGAIAEEKNFSKLEDCLRYIWKHNPKLHVSAIANSNVHIMKAIKHTRLAPEIYTSHDIGFKDDELIIKNNSIYTLNGIYITISFLYKDQGEYKREIRIDNLLAGEMHQLENPFPNSGMFGKKIIKDSIKISYSCKEDAYF